MDGSEQPIKAEMQDAWETMFDQERYSDFKTGIRKIMEIIAVSSERGEARKGMEGLLSYFKA